MRFVRSHFLFLEEIIFAISAESPVVILFSDYIAISPTWKEIPFDPHAPT